MQIRMFAPVLAAAVLGLASGAWAAEPTTAPAAAPAEGSGGPPGMHHMMGAREMGHRMEKSAYLGLGIRPADEVLSEQLGLPKGSGMVVEFVEPDSPAAKAGVKRHDVLAKLNDQILFNQPQLVALVHTFKAGDAVTLTLIHEGKAAPVQVTLAEKEQPVFEGGIGMPMPFMHPMGGREMMGGPRHGQAERGRGHGGPGDEQGDDDRGPGPGGGHGEGRQGPGHGMQSDHDGPPGGSGHGDDKPEASDQ